MNSQKNKIYLGIGGMVIKIIFHENDNYCNKNFFISQLKLFYREFILQNNQCKSIFSINVYNQSLLFIEKNTIGVKRQFVLISKEYFKSKKINTYYSISLNHLSFLITHILQKLLSSHKGLMLHASSLIDKGKAILFLGVSGAGKSTVVHLLKNKAKIFTDDTVIIKNKKNSYFCYQTSIIEKNQYKKDRKGYPIKKIFFLKQSKKFKSEKITNKERIIKLLSKQIFTEKKYLPKQMLYILKLIKSLDEFYFLHFRKNENEIEEIINQN